MTVSYDYHALFSDSLEFRDAIFGPADYPTPILLDQVICVGNETEILDCSHRPVGVHNCRHSQDISIDCLGRSTGKHYTKAHQRVAHI